jgi:N-glycosylase/DNA lyase
MSNTSYTIERYNNITRIVNISKDELDLDKTLDCGQSFRWKKSHAGYWYGIIDNELVTIIQGIFKDGKEGLATNLKVDNIDKLINYFNLDMNYTDEIIKLNLDEYVKASYNVGKGIHILRQDIFETMVTFLMSQFNSMHNIRLIVNRLSETYGDKKEVEWVQDKVTAYTFPTIETLSKCTINDFKSLSIGLRSQYLYNMCQQLSNNPQLIDELKQCNYETSINILQSFNGIGPKVANCIALFALHHIESFPIDTHIQRIINREYNGNINLSSYGNIAGIIQQYMYYNEAFNNKK